MKTDWTITLDNNPRDFIVYREGSGRSFEIFDIAVGSERRNGKGRALIAAMLRVVNPQDDCVEKRPSLIYAVTRISNTVAHQFYEACGFRLFGRLHNFYRDGSDIVESALVYGLDV